MICTISPPSDGKNDEFQPYLVDWELAGPFYKRTTFAPMDTSKLIHKYTKLWFEEGSNQIQQFDLGYIHYYEGDESIYFVNGRHRTNLLSLYLRYIPIHVDVETFKPEDLKKSLVQDLSYNQEFELPDLPIICPVDMIKVAPESCELNFVKK